MNFYLLFKFLFQFLKSLGASKNFILSRDWDYVISPMMKVLEVRKMKPKNLEVGQYDLMSLRSRRPGGVSVLSN